VLCGGHDDNGDDPGTGSEETADQAEGGTFGEEEAGDFCRTGAGSHPEPDFTSALQLRSGRRGSRGEDGEAEEHRCQGKQQTVEGGRNSLAEVLQMSAPTGNEMSRALGIEWKGNGRADGEAAFRHGLDDELMIGRKVQLLHCGVG
jgi:hypothetical protein